MKEGESQGEGRQAYRLDADPEKERLLHFCNDFGLTVDGSARLLPHTIDRDLIVPIGDVHELAELG